MQAVKLSPGQIETLFKFTEKKSVRWYDLQVELVDHLACKIEEEMEQDNTLSFEKALEKVYKGFGLFGFSHIVQDKLEAVHNRTSALWKKEIKAYFKLPKIVFTVMVFVALWILIRLFTAEHVFFVFTIAYLASMITVWIKEFRIKRRSKKKLMMLNGSVFHESWFSSVIRFCIIVGSFTNPIAVCVIATAGILFEIASHQVYTRVRDEALRAYPEAFKMKPA